MVYRASRFSPLFAGIIDTDMVGSVAPHDIAVFFFVLFCLFLFAACVGATDNKRPENVL